MSLKGKFLGKTSITLRSAQISKCDDATFGGKKMHAILMEEQDLGEKQQCLEGHCLASGLL